MVYVILFFKQFFCLDNLSGARLLYKSYLGDVPCNAMFDWLSEDKELMQLVMKAFRLGYNNALEPYYRVLIFDPDTLLYIDMNVVEILFCNLLVQINIRPYSLCLLLGYLITAMAVNDVCSFVLFVYTNCKALFGDPMRHFSELGLHLSSASISPILLCAPEIWLMMQPLA